MSLPKHTRLLGYLRCVGWMTTVLLRIDAGVHPVNVIPQDGVTIATGRHWVGIKPVSQERFADLLEDCRLVLSDEAVAILQGCNQQSSSQDTQAD